jgi:lipid-binding SYLF domain-containing protein
MRRIQIALLVLAPAFTPGLLFSKADAAARLDSAADLLSDMMKASDKGVPQDLLNKAECVILIPGLKKAAFVIGAKYGRGFALCRSSTGTGWSGPAAVRIEGGSFGLQVGGSEQDVMLLVMNETGMKHLLKDKFTIGGEATAAAGPVGRDLQAQTDAVMRAEMLAYSRSRGLFAGISLEGSTLRPDDDANQELYNGRFSNRDILMGSVKPPSAAERLEKLLNRNSSRLTR